MPSARLRKPCHGGSEVCSSHPALVSLFVHLQGVPHALGVQALINVGLDGPHGPAVPHVIDIESIVGSEDLGDGLLVDLRLASAAPCSHPSLVLKRVELLWLDPPCFRERPGWDLHLMKGPAVDPFLRAGEAGSLSGQLLLRRTPGRRSQENLLESINLRFVSSPKYYVLVPPTLHCLGGTLFNKSRL